MTARLGFVTLAERIIPVNLPDESPVRAPSVPADQAATLTLAALRELQALQGVGDEILDSLLPRSRLLQLGAGQRLLQGGEPNLYVYIVLSGALRVELEDGSSPVARIGRGETVGELSLLAGSLATATVVAEEPAQLLVLDEQTFWWLAQSSHEFSVGLLVRLAKRMRSNNEAVRASIALRRHFEQAALSDPTTGFRNRRWLDEMLPRIIQRHVHASSPLCVAIMDIDHFKRINDTFGHAAGDTVLVRMAEIVRDNLRPTDMASRMGGEEFALILPETALPGAIIAAERVREAVAAAAFEHEGSALPHLTVSIGLGQLEGSEDAHRLLAQADEALYRAKRAGRDRVEWPGNEDSKDSG
jgi:diguanylate cyclase (GGDEF)-like protein